MTFPSGQHVPGDATIWPTQPANGKEYPVGMAADADGHIRGSLPAWGFITPPIAAGANKVYMDLFNNEAGKILRLRKLFAIVDTSVAVTGTLGVRLDFMRTSSVGTAGTAFAGGGAASALKTVATFWPFKPGDTLPAGVTARNQPTGGAADEQWLFFASVFTEETNQSSQMSQWFNLLPELPAEQPMELPQGKGLKIVQGSVASVGNIGLMGCFTVE